MIVAIGTLLTLGIVATFVLSSILSGWALSILWAWFVVPLGVQNIGIAHSIGICTVGRLIMGGANGIGKDDKKEDQYDKLIRSIIVMLLFPLISVLIGWIAKNFM